MSTSILSDSNVSGVSTIVSRSRVYSDFDLTMQIHPIRKSLIPLKDIEAVKASVRNLVLTSFMERPFQPRLGSNLRAILFEPADLFTAMSLKDAITNVLIEYEPRVDDIIVQVWDDPDNNAYSVTVTFTVISVSESVEVSLLIERLR